MIQRTFVLLNVLSLLIPMTIVHAQGDGDITVPEGIPGEVIYIPFPVPITLDGNLNDWNGIPTYTVDKGTSTSLDPTENGSFTFAVAADAASLYIMMIMPDQNIIAGQHGSNFWNEDSLEFFLNLTGDFYAPNYGDGIHQVNIPALDIGNTDPADLNVSGVRSSEIEVRALVFKTADGWGFEAAVPLADLFEIKHGAEIGFQVQANGAAEMDRNVKLIWSNTDTNDTSWQDPSVFGRALFFELGQTDIPHPSKRPASSDATFDVDAVDWSAIVRATWEGYKRNLIFCGEACGNNMGLVFDPNIGYQSVSEGIGYGMLMAVMMDDQATFDIIYDAAYTIMLDQETGLLNWRVDNTGTITGYKSATDAEEDIAAALIFAQSRVDRGEWTQHEGRPYGVQAQSVLDAIYRYEVYGGKYLTPGDGWESDGQDILNLSYFMPAWYRVFDAFEGGERWRPVITYGYRSLFLTDGASLGLAPDWSTSEGGPAYDYCDTFGRPREHCRYEMYYDAIRVPWRIGMDCLWFGDSQACEWSQRTAAFLKSLPAEDFARMYDMEGNPIVNYRDELAVGMWLVTAMAAQNADLVSQLAGQLYSYAGNALENGYWGDSSHYYFNQSLAWFAAALVSGDFQNLYESK